MENAPTVVCRQHAGGSTVVNDVTGYQDANLRRGGFVGHALDSGGASQGHRIDDFMNTGAQTVSQFGEQNVTVYVLGK